MIIKTHNYNTITKTHIMKKNILIAGILSALSLTVTAQASQSPVYYTLGKSYNSAYTTRYDSTFGMSLKGIYSFCTDNYYGFDIPNVKGAQLGIHTNIQGGSVFHELSLNVGILQGSENYYGVLKLDQRLIPITFGYTLNIPMSDITTFFLGGKVGFLSSESKLKVRYENINASITDNDCKGTYAIQLGFKFAIGEKTDFVIGYEMNKYFSDVDVYHSITAGISWNF